MSIRRRLTILLLLTFGLLLGAGGAVIFFWTHLALEKEFDAALRARLQAMAAFVWPTGAGLDLAFLESFEAGSRLKPMPEYFEVLARDGTCMARSPALGSNSIPARFGAIGEVVCWDLTLPDGTPGRAAGMRFIAQAPVPVGRSSPHASSGSGLPPSPVPVELGLVLAENVAPLQADLNTLATVVLVTGLLTLVATVALVPVVLRLGLAPLRRMGAQAEAIDANSLQARFATDSIPAELKPIADCLNDLFARIEESLARERRFSADLAHELRTPIAGLRATAEVALKYGETTDRESFEAVLEITQQMETLVTSLLALARSEQESLPLQPQAVAVAALVRELWEPLAARATQRRVTPRFEVPEEAQLHTDPTLLHAVLANLLTNAADYCAEGGDLRLRFTAREGRFELTLTNTVRDLKPADVAQFFDRFWRKDRSRHDPAHAGLGLPLARSFARLLGWELHASLVAEDRLSLALTGPVRRS